jgi:hypothetical protein
MTSGIAIEEIKQRLQKQDTNTNSNILDEEFEDALNRGLSDWIRRQHHGSNIFKEGDENTEQRIDDLQILLKEKYISVNNKDVYAETSVVPSDYRYYKRLTPIVSKDICTNVRIKSYFVEEANADDYLKDWTFKPSFDFEETFHTMLSNKFRVYHNKDFTVNEAILTYYRNPLYISCKKADYDKVWEWKDDVARSIINEAVKILAGDIENINAYEIADKKQEQDN